MPNENNSESYKDINIDSLDLTGDEETITGEVTQGDNNKQSKFFGGSGGPGGIIKWIIIAVISILVLTGVFFTAKHFINNRVDKAGNKVETVSKNKNNNEKAKDLFKQSIRSAVDAQKNKHNISVSWRDATLDYGQSGNAESFKEKLSSINDDRISDFEKIPEDSSPLNNLVIESLNNMRDYMNRAFNAKDPEEAISIYNDWNTSDKDFDARYIDELIKLLESNKIKYEKTESDGNTTISY